MRAARAPCGSRVACAHAHQRLLTARPAPKRAGRAPAPRHAAAVSEIGGGGKVEDAPAAKRGTGTAMRHLGGAGSATRPPHPTPQPPAALPVALAAAAESAKAVLAPLLAAPAALQAAAAAGVVLALAAIVKRILDTPSRTYDPSNPNVGTEYDAWTK